MENLSNVIRIDGLTNGCLKKKLRNIRIRE